MEENTTTAAPEDDLRSSLEEAFDEKAPEPEQNEPESPPEAEKPAEEPEKEAKPAENEGLSEKKAEETADSAPDSDKTRDEKGRFASKDEKTGVKAAEKVGQPPDEPEPLDLPERELSTKRAPEAWSPEAREYWKDIPEQAKKEIIRHNQLIYDTLDKTTQERKFANAVRQTVEPYRSMIEKDGGNVIQSIGQLMDTAKRLRTSPAHEKATLVAGLIKQFGVDVQQLDRALTGLPVQVDPVAQRIEQELAPVREWKEQMAQQQRMQQYQQDQELQHKVNQFYQTDPEFINDVANKMAEIYDGQMSMQEAYDEACWATPSVRKVLLQRQEAQRLQQQNEVASKAKNAAVSVGGSAPVTNPNQENPSSIREALELAMSRSVR